MLEDLKGSDALRKKMPFGVIKKIAIAFNHTDAWVARVIAGTSRGNVAIIKCAIEIADLNTKVESELTEILKNYGKSNN